MYYSSTKEHQAETLMKGFKRDKSNRVWYESNYTSVFCGYGKIYTLADKVGNVFYVGCTTQNIEVRVGAHISEARVRSRGGKMNRKCARIIELNYEIYATIVDMQYVAYYKQSATDKLYPLEKKWIEKYISLGYNLCNKEALIRERKVKEAIPEFVGQTVVTSFVKDVNSSSRYDDVLKISVK